MKRFSYKFTITLLTLALGLASVFFFNSLSEIWRDISVEMPKGESEAQIAVIPKEQPTVFSTIGSGCGGENIYGGSSSGVGYKTEEGQIVSLGSSYYDKTEMVQRELRIRLEEANEIIESNKLFDSDSKEIGKRIILETGKENKRYEILRYDDNKVIRTIAAPTLKLALEFENYYLSNLR